MAAIAAATVISGLSDIAVIIAAVFLDAGDAGDASNLVAAVAVAVDVALI